MASTAFYNEHDRYPAAWLRNLIAAGHIAKGVVDERSVRDIEPADLAGFTQAHFFAGIGAWSYALRLAGWPDDAPVWTGSCPCQPFSVAGKGRGVADDRHLWPAWFRLIRECRPAVVFGEQVGGAAGLAWLDLVHADLEGAGYAVGAACLPAASVGAPHARNRQFFVAHAHGARGPRLVSVGGSGAASPWGRFGESDLCRIAESPTREGHCWPQPIVRAVDDGATARVGRLRAYGNAIVAPLAAEFIAAAMEAFIVISRDTFPLESRLERQAVADGK